MANILVVDDFSGMRAALADGLKQVGAKIDQAENGRSAIAMLDVNRYDLVITDIQMPHVDGVKLLKWIKENVPETKVILITGFSHILETQDAYQLGADQFLLKPIHLNELLEIVHRLIGRALHVRQQNVEQEYCQISLDQIAGVAAFKSRLFLRVGTTTFIRIAEAGELITSDKIELYKRKGVDSLYCLMADADAWLR